MGFHNGLSLGGAKAVPPADIFFHTASGDGQSEGCDIRHLDPSAGVLLRRANTSCADCLHTNFRTNAIDCSVDYIIAVEHIMYDMYQVCMCTAEEIKRILYKEYILLLWRVSLLCMYVCVNAYNTINTRRLFAL